MTMPTYLSRGVQALFVVACGVAWYAATVHGAINPLLLPQFGRTMGDLWVLLRDGEFWPDLFVTMYELVVAFSMAALLGLIVGYFVGRARFTTRVCEPLFSTLYSVPTILLFPLFVLFFGIGPGSKIAMGATIAFFPVVLTTIAGIGNTDASLVKAARSMGATNWQMFWLVMAPASLPVVISGLRLGLILALLAILGSETIASLSGLGRQIVNFSDALETSKMFAYTLLVIAIATALNGLVTAAEGFVRRRVG